MLAANTAFPPTSTTSSSSPPRPVTVIGIECDVAFGTMSIWAAPTDTSTTSLEVNWWVAWFSCLIRFTGGAVAFDGVATGIISPSSSEMRSITAGAARLLLEICSPNVAVVGLEWVAAGAFAGVSCWVDVAVVAAGVVLGS